MTKKTKKVAKAKESKIIIFFFTDESCEMERMVINKDGLNHLCFEGNTWDNHGSDRFDAVCSALKHLGIKFTSKVGSYKYDDGTEEDAYDKHGEDEGCG